MSRNTKHKLRKLNLFNIYMLVNIYIYVIVVVVGEFILRWVSGVLWPILCCPLHRTFHVDHKVHIESRIRHIQSGSLTQWFLLVFCIPCLRPLLYFIQSLKGGMSIGSTILKILFSAFTAVVCVLALNVIINLILITSVSAKYSKSIIQHDLTSVHGHKIRYYNLCCLSV